MGYTSVRNEDELPWRLMSGRRRGSRTESERRLRVRTVPAQEEPKFSRSG